MKKIIITDHLLDRLANEYAICSIFGIPVNKLISFGEYVERRIAEIELSLMMAA